MELEHFNRQQTALPGFLSEVTTFFFNSAGGELEKMDENVTDVWEECGVLGVTVTLIRSTITTVA